MAPYSVQRAGHEREAHRFCADLRKRLRSRPAFQQTVHAKGDVTYFFAWAKSATIPDWNSRNAIDQSFEDRSAWLLRRSIRDAALSYALEIKTWALIATNHLHLVR